MKLLLTAVITAQSRKGPFCLPWVMLIHPLIYFFSSWIVSEILAGTYSVIDFVIHCVLGYLSFKFAILVAAFKSRSSGHSIYYTEPITCPTLHVFGDTDRVIPKGMY